MSKVKINAKNAEEEEEENLKVKIYIMGHAYDVPATLTIMKAMEYVGYKFTRGSGCRAGFCGACSTVYRKEGDFRIYTALACQTMVEEGMVLTQLPFVPADKPTYDMNALTPSASSILRFYPEVARCLSCNACSKVCPQDIQVMDYIQFALQGQIERSADESFDCVSCGLCVIRCPAEIPQYHVAQLVRRLYGKYLMKTPNYLDKRIDEIKEGKYEDGFKELMTLSKEALEEKYKKRDMEK